MGLKVGDKVIWYKSSAGSSYNIMAKIPVTILRIGKGRITVQTHDGLISRTIEENLEKVKNENIHS